MTCRATPLGALALAVAAVAGAGTPKVTITSPDPAQAVFDAVEVTIDVVCDEPVTRVEVFVDGRRVAILRQPPWTARVDVGPYNAEHRFRAVAFAASGASVAAAVETPRVHVDEENSYDLQQLYVTATRDGERVLDLERSEVEISDDRRVQRVVSFAHGDVPFTAVILVDASASMAGAKLAAALDGARTFSTAMQPLDEAKLMVFSDRVLAETPFLSRGDELVEEAGRVTAQGGTALNDALYVALGGIEERQGRRVVIVLSDGLDSHSVLSIDDLLPSIRRSRALVYWLRLGLAGSDIADRDPGSQFSAWRNGDGHRRQVEAFAGAVVDSGGRIVPVGGAAEIVPRFAEILRELREQVVIGYYPSNGRNDGAWHDVEVRSLRRGVRLRTSKGYFDD